MASRPSNQVRGRCVLEERGMKKSRGKVAARCEVIQYEEEHEKEGHVVAL